MHTCLERITTRYVIDIYSNCTNQSVLLDIYDTILVLFYFDKNEKFGFPNETEAMSCVGPRARPVGTARDVTIFSTFLASPTTTKIVRYLLSVVKGRTDDVATGTRCGGLLRRGRLNVKSNGKNIVNNRESPRVQPRRHGGKKKANRAVRKTAVVRAHVRFPFFPFAHLRSFSKRFFSSFPRAAPRVIIITISLSSPPRPRLPPKRSSSLPRTPLRSAFSFFICYIIVIVVVIIILSFSILSLLLTKLSGRFDNRHRQPDESPPPDKPHI